MDLYTVDHKAETITFARDIVIEASPDGEGGAVHRLSSPSADIAMDLSSDSTQWAGSRLFNLNDMAAAHLARIQAPGKTKAAHSAADHPASD